MKLSREPVVWRTALAGIVAALVTLGVLAQPAADEIGGGLDALLTAVVALLPIVAGVLARGKVAPADADAGVRLLALGSDGVYRPAGQVVAEGLDRRAGMVDPEVRRRGRVDGEDL